MKSDLTGKTFGRFLVVKEAEKDDFGNLQWICICECGKQRTVAAGNLRSGRSLSCGCYAIERIKACNTKHGHTRRGVKHSRTYAIWASIKARCCNQNCPAFKDYGGRGIFMDDEWSSSFLAFLRDMGTAPEGKEIDRIDNDRGYFSLNCHWVSRKENARNKRNNHFVEHNGERLTLSQLEERLGIQQATIRRRLKSGWSPEKALSTEVRS